MIEEATASTLVVDTSAAVAIILDERGGQELSTLLEQVSSLLMSAVT